MTEQGQHRSRPRSLVEQCEGVRESIRRGAVDDALGALDDLRRSHPSDADVLRLSAEAFAAASRPIDALRALDRIVEVERADASDWKRMGCLLCEVGEFAQGLGALQRSIELDPSDVEAWYECGRASYKLGDTTRAVIELGQAVRLTDVLAPKLALATTAPGADELTQEDILRVRRDFAAALAVEELKSPPETPCDTTSDGKKTEPPRSGTDGKIRVGFVSSWFDRENYMKPVWALINAIDRDQFVVYCYCDTPTDGPDDLPGYQSRDVDRLVATAGWSNGRLADAINADGIDILVDLNAYSTPERLGLFLYRCAPVMAAWFNMYATSGLPEIDYIIGDDQVVGADEDQYYSETVARLPLSYLTFSVTHQAPPVVPPPLASRGYVTFGSLVTQYKITPTVIATWSELLGRVDRSHLLIGNTALASAENRRYVQDAFAGHGIDPGRLTFRGPASHDKFLRYYDEIDIALDAFPYNGGTTTMEAIWQGVPVVAYRGDRWASRTSASILSGTHLSSWVASDRRGYVDLAAQMATDADCLGRLTELRQTMRTRLTSSSVCDAAALARAMEDLFRKWLVQGH
ncbi:MAG: tetratricopeptide repeat protein [Planctomycetales bacterium]|nr:tetratricopeptide repeat protein [Planctomycetales bacterium]